MEHAANSTPIAGFQSLGRSWEPRREDILRLLETSDHRQVQPIYYGSNHCFLVLLDAGEDGCSLSVYKPARGEYPLYDFASGSLYRREAASYLVNKILGWEIVPPTVVTSGKYGVGSLQLYIESQAEGEVEIQELQRLTLLDAVLNNADRKSDHCLLGNGGKLWGIDHGLTFHVHPKLRTVLWHFSGRPIPSGELADLRLLSKGLTRRSAAEAEQIQEFISRQEWSALLARLNRLIDEGKFPDPRYKPVPYRW